MWIRRDALLLTPSSPKRDFLWIRVYNEDMWHLHPCLGWLLWQIKATLHIIRESFIFTTITFKFSRTELQYPQFHKKNNFLFSDRDNSVSSIAQFFITLMKVTKPSQICLLSSKQILMLIPREILNIPYACKVTVNCVFQFTETWDVSMLYYML